jgi:hypothetical protein
MKTTNINNLSKNFFQIQIQKQNSSQLCFKPFFLCHQSMSHQPTKPIHPTSNNHIKDLLKQCPLVKVKFSEEEGDYDEVPVIGGNKELASLILQQVWDDEQEEEAIN